MTKEEYAEYLQSPRWRLISQAMREAYQVCQRCEFPYELNVHHLTYERLGKETIGDLIVLCRSCHSREHFLEDIEKHPYLVGKQLDQVKNKIFNQIEIARIKNSRRNDELKRKQDEK